mmetsp:Transcript_87572/g.187885  ORF Transcript_87572/g.187885 Transcript_87572/m.187885 type:complete len:431 (+) Transcript_87572:50-1342(+)
MTPRLLVAAFLLGRPAASGSAPWYDDEVAPCDQVCKFQGKYATCRSRMEEATEHQFQGQANACTLAHKLVLQQCGEICERCSQSEAGCPGATTSMPYDCAAGVSHWRKGWSANKKIWCCQAGGGSNVPGCVDITTHCLWDCKAGYSNWQKGWSIAKKEWCCRHENVACPFSTTQAPPYDCLAGFDQWRTDWSDSKKVWCCANEGKGCPSTSHSCKWDCEAGYANWVKGWSAEKKEWCCSNAGRGCPSDLTSKTTSTSASVTLSEGLPFDCTAAIDHWATEWSIRKKAWCCQHTGNGCMSTTTPCVWDCEAGFSNWHKGWSLEKKAWCCKFRGRGCDSGTPVPYLTAKYGGSADRQAEDSSHQAPARSFSLLPLCLVAGGGGLAVTAFVTRSSVLPMGARGMRGFPRHQGPYESLPLTEQSVHTQDDSALE